jgi:hypothetical protein
MQQQRQRQQQQQQQQQQQPSGMPGLPAGHPDISHAQPTTQPAAGDMPALPKGHPDISKLSQNTMQPVAGNLIVRAVQSTAGGPAIGADPVSVSVYGHNQLIGKLDAKLEADGTVRVDNIPTGAGYQVVARVTHGGVDFEAVCEAKDKAVELTVPVYESTDQRPDWSVQMRHAVVHAGDDGLHVMEVMAIENPTDRAWAGEAPGADGKRTTFVLPLPAGAGNVKVGAGFHDCCTTIADGKITNTMALVPGVTQYQFSYTLPVTNGKAELIATAPAAVKTMLVLLPETAIVSADGLDGPKSANMGQGNMQYFKSTNLPANKQVKLTIDVGSVKKVTKTGAAAADGFDGATAAKAIGGVGAILVVLLGGAFLLMKSPRASRASR